MEEKSSGIEVGKNYEKTPEILCPHCGGLLHLRIDGFKPDITQIVKSNCTNCGGEIYACLLIVTDVTMRGVVGAAQEIAKLFREEKKRIITPANA